MNKIFFKVIVLFILIGSIFILYNNKMYINQNKIDKVKLRSNGLVDKNIFAIMLEDKESETGYKKSDSTTWPEEGYKFNSEISGCMDEEDKKIEDENILTFDNESHTATVDIDKTVYCYLYFDKDEGFCKSSNNGELKKGTTYVTDQYIYNYMYEWNGINNRWTDLSIKNVDGWGVRLRNYNSTDPITEQICSSIDGRPVVSMREMFYNYKITNLDLSNWDTSNVVNMNLMFNKSSISNLNISDWDTSNVTTMSGMFESSQVTEIKGLKDLNLNKVEKMRGMFQSANISNIDLSGWKTKNVTDISGLFLNSSLTEIIGYENLNTSNVTDMSSLFYNSKLSSIDISSWDTSKVTSMNAMFYGALANKIIIGNKDTSSLTNIGNMFYNTSNLSEIDLSGFDINNLVNEKMQNMFTGTSATVGWAKDANNANLLNNTLGKPSQLTFKVKT